MAALKVKVSGDSLCLKSRQKASDSSVNNRIVGGHGLADVAPASVGRPRHMGARLLAVSTLPAPRALAGCGPLCLVRNGRGHCHLAADPDELPRRAAPGRLSDVNCLFRALVPRSRCVVHDGRREGSADGKMIVACSSRHDYGIGSAIGMS